MMTMTKRPAPPTQSQSATTTTTTTKLIGRRPRVVRYGDIIDDETSRMNRISKLSHCSSSSVSSHRVLLTTGLTVLLVVASSHWVNLRYPLDDITESDDNGNIIKRAAADAHATHLIIVSVTVILLAGHFLLGDEWFRAVIRPLPTHWVSSVSKIYRYSANYGNKTCRSSSNNNNNSGPLAQLKRVASGSAISQFKSAVVAASCSFSSRVTLQAITHQQQCFARVDYIERLSINDIAILYRYALKMSHRHSHNNKGHPDRTAFRNDQSEIVRGIITAIDMAVKVSRGCLADRTSATTPTTTTTTNISRRDDFSLLGEIDALYFVAVTRIFAEWRTLRLVPDGYQRYAVALGLGYRDMLQNLEKIERGAHSYYRYHRSKQQQYGQHHPILSPTLREILEFEVETGVHSKLPYLAEKSAASGLLWTKRQLHYQVATLSNSLEVPDYYPSPKDAAQAAYREVYQDYHGWTVKQVFSHSLSGSPPLEKIWMTMDPPKDLPKDRTKSRHQSPKTRGTTQQQTIHINHRTETLTTSKNSQQSVQIMTSTSCTSSFDEYDSPTRQLSDVTDHSSQRSVVDDASSIVRRLKDEEHEKMDNEFHIALDKLSHGIAEKWDDLLRLFHCGKKEEKKKHNENLILSRDSHFDLSMLQSSDMDSRHEDVNHERNNKNDANACRSSSSFSSSSSLSATSRIAAKSKQDTADFVHELSPILADLSELFDYYGMNDPSRV